MSYFLFDIQYEIEYLNWFNFYNFLLIWGFYCDRFICIMLFLIILIATCVIYYSIDYLYYDPFLIKFLSYLFLFIFFMFLLITSNNLLQLFFGWEGVGLCSFLLITFWYSRIPAIKAGLKALIINRIGDLLLLFAFIFISYFCKTLNYQILSSIIFYFQNYNIIIFNYEFHLISIICFFLLLGAVGKSAQIGLHTWLPDAMEGPTPVSALIHAATMVTAGIFLIIKCSFLFEYSNFILLLIMFIGGLTALMASTIGLVQNDIKKIIAYSTCSQLGLMLLICGLSCYTISLFHLLTHACFKALLFLIAGTIIHQLQDEQDIRKYGNLCYFLPFLNIILIIASFSLMGFPFLAGFYSKDLLIENIFNYKFFFHNFFFFLISIITLLSSMYSVRLIIKTFFFSVKTNYSLFFSFHQLSFFFFFVLLILTFCSIFIGYFYSIIFSIIGNTFFSNSIFISYKNDFNFEFEFFLPFLIKNMPLLLSFCGFLLIFLFIESRVVLRIISVFSYFFILARINFYITIFYFIINIFKFLFKIFQIIFKFFYLIRLYLNIVFFWLLVVVLKTQIGLNFLLIFIKKKYIFRIIRTLLLFCFFLFQMFLYIIIKFCSIFLIYFKFNYLKKIMFLFWNLIFFLILFLYYLFSCNFFFFFKFLIQKWFFDLIQLKLCGLWFFIQSFNLFLILDKGFLEKIGPAGLLTFTIFSNKFNQFLHNMILSSYILKILFFFLVIISIFFL